MSIALLDLTPRSSSNSNPAGKQPPLRLPVASQRRLAANRRNAQRSTGPRTASGKRRSARNAMKHGLCAALSHLPSECDATFHTYVAELEEELRPATAIQRVTFTQIANLSWRLMRLPEAQSKVFAEEMAKVSCADGEALRPSDVLARRFSDDPGSNGFANLDRYERGMRAQLLRLLRYFDYLKKHRPTTPYDPDEPPCPPEGSQPAWTEEKAAAQRAWFAEQERLFKEGKQPDAEWLRLREIQQRAFAEAAKKEAAKPDWLELRQEHVRRDAEELAKEKNAAPTGATAPATPTASTDPPRDEEHDARGARDAGEAKRTQSNPPENPDSDRRAGKCAIAGASPLTKRTQRARAPVPAAHAALQSAPHPPGRAGELTT